MDDNMMRLSDIGFANNGGGAAFGNPQIARQGETQRQMMQRVLEYLRMQQQPQFAPSTAAVRG